MKFYRCVKLSSFLVYENMVRPHLVYANLVWNPHRKQDIEKVKRVELRAGEMTRRLRNLTKVNQVK